jgi:tape measure domain-containing protein
MAENKISKSDISEEDVFKYITESAQKSITVLNQQNQELNELANALGRISKVSNTNTLKGINDLLKAMKDLEVVKQKAIDTDTQKARIEAELLKVEREKVKLDSETIKNSRLKQTEQEKANKASERAKKLADDEANAYKKLAKATNELKNESKRLGAEMLNLEQNGKKNTDQYRKLAIQYNATTLAAKQGDAQLKKLDERVGDNQRKVGSYTEAVGRLRNALGGLGLALGGAQILNFFTGNEIQLQRMQLALQNVMGTTEKYNDAFSYLTNLSKDYGQDLLVLTDTYKSFIAASESSNLSISEINKIYESVIKSGSSLALSNEQIQGSLLAISQMFSKGTVSAEELRGQLGERLPGAFGIMAKSMGVSEQKLGKMLEQGQVMAKDVLPAFAVELDKTFGANAQKNLNTVGGSWNVLKTNLMLYINEGNNANGVTSKIASGFMFLAKNLGTIIEIGGKAIKWFLIYKTSIIAINTYNNLATLGFKGIGEAILRNIPFTKQYTLAQQQAALASEQAGVSASRAGKLINAVPWALIATALFEVGSALWEIASGAKQAEEDMARLNATTEDATKSLDKNINEILERQRKRNKEIQDQLTAKNITQEQFIKLQKQSSELTIKELRTNKNDVIERKNAYIKDFLFIKAENKKILNTTNIDVVEARTKLAESIAKKYNIKANKDVLGYDLPFIPEDVMGQLEANIQGANVKIKGYTTAIVENKEAIESNKAELIGLAKVDTKIDKRTKEQREINTEFKQTNQYLSEQIRLLNEIQQIENQRILDQMDKNIDEMLRLSVQSTSQNGQIESDLLEEMINDRYDLQKEYERKKSELQIQSIIDTYNREKIIRENNLIEERDQLLKGAKGDQVAIDKINANYEIEKEKLRLEEIERVKDLETQKVVINEQSKDAITEIEKEKQNQINKVNDELIDAQIEFYDTQNGIIKEKTAEQLEQEKKTAEERKKIAKDVRDTLEKYGEDLIQREIERSRRKQDLMQKESDRAKDREQQLRELANNGNATASQSLALAEAQSLKRQQAIDREAKKQQAWETAKIAYKAVFDFMEKGDSLPIATVKGATGTMTMQSLFKSLFGFRKGTKRTVGEELASKFSSGEDGYLARVDAREKILNPELASMTGSATTDEIVDGFLNFQKLNSGLIVPITARQEQQKPDVLAKKLDELTNVVKSKPEFSMHPDIVMGIVKGITTEEKRGLTRNRTKFRS